jgi:MFS family permease
MAQTLTPALSTAPGKVVDPRERDYVRNVSCLTAVEVGWGFAMSFGFSATFIQLVLKDLGASHWQIGLLAAMWGFGTVPMVLAGYFTGHLRRKKAVVIWGHFACVLPVIFLALALRWLPGNAARIWSVLGAEYAFAAGVGLLMPIWLTFMGKTLPARRLGAGFGITFFCQTLAGAGAAWVASHLLRRDPGRTADCVAVSALAMIVGNLFFFPVREPETAADERPGGFRVFLATLLRDVRGNRDLRNFLLAEILFTSQFAIAGFYAARAADFGGGVATGAALATRVALAQAFAALAAGFLVDRVGPKPVLAAGRLAIAGAAALAWKAQNVEALMIAATAVGAYFGVRSAASFATFRAVLGRDEVTSLYGIFSLVVAPFAVAVPLVAGWALGRHITHGTLFLASGAAVVLSVLLLALGVRTKPAHHA